MGSERKAAGKSQQPDKTPQPDKKLVTVLTKQMQESLLPGDLQFEKPDMADAAAFVARIAYARDADRSAMGIETVTGDRRFMRIAVINDDMPFLVDSIAGTIAALGLTIDRLVHPVLPVDRNDDGILARILPASDKNAARESMIYIETERTDARQRRELERDLRVTLGDVRAAVADWPRLQDTMTADAATIADEEGAALLQWLNSGMLTQLGHMTRNRDGGQSQVLGVCRKSARDLMADQSYTAAFAWFDDQGPDARAPLIVKANRVSNVHRRVPLDLVMVPVRDGKKVTALSIHAGVWTSAALAAPPTGVPRLRTHLTGLMSRFGFDAKGHAGKSLTHALTALPHDLVIGFSDRDIERVATTMMSLVDRPRVRLALVEAPLGRHVFAFVWLPRDMLSTDVRLRIQALLERGTGSSLLDWSLMVEGGNLAMLRFVLDSREGGALPDSADMESELQDMLRGWTEAVETELAVSEDQSRIAAIAARYADAFPASYRAEYGAAEAARDIVRLRNLSSPDQKTVTNPAVAEVPRRDARLYHLDGDADNRLRMKIYQHEGSMDLSDSVPALENFGLRVLSEIPTELDDGRLGTVHDYLLALPDGDTVHPLLERAEAIENAVAAVLNGQAEDDPFNRLVIGTGLSERETTWLRAFYRYLRQAGMGFTIYTVVDALRSAPDVTRGLIGLFTARHDPGFDGDRSDAAESMERAIATGLSKVAAINDDRLLRLYKSVIDAILRTNAFAPAAEEALAFKIDSALIPNLPKPVPWREIFVYSRRVEGIHLRSGPVARGGLRWSDRRDDFRTEILGLMKAQRVKNAVIVPTGAKGGFYPKQLPNPARDRDGWAAEGQAAYEIFIRTLLSVTDNLANDKVVHPDAVVRHDGDDPYFVVAADKGTARFSDVANGIAQSQDFWLDDAFASGGSNGYDHKAMGITARGAWVSVQRHFLEMDVDVQVDPIQVVGCGDMSGDVFGNGMLLSKSLKLVAAFDHRHIFLDPDPDPAKSWAERQRLYDLPRSSWEDYDAKLISKGGGVFARDLKTIPLSKAMRSVLETDAKSIDPDALISAIMTAPMDLIWFGGIGTYIKSSAENNVQVGDPANDSLRVDAADLRAKVIGEGANLGVTQAARIEFSLGGGRINTDFIDNSAGVDCSDNEVNIKIALAAASRAGKLSEKKRSALLVSMTEEVGAHVLEDNRLQALALSIAETGGTRATSAQLRLVESLEESGNLDRRTEGLADGEALARRSSDGMGLTRPELAVLLSSTKLVLQDAIESSSVPDDPTLEPMLMDYFPSQMRGAFKRQITGHQLRRELLATIIANRIVNRMGMVNPFELAEEEGASLDQMAAAFVAAERLFGMDDLWTMLDTANMPETARLMLFDRAALAMRSQMADLLRAGVGQSGNAKLVNELERGITDLSQATDILLGDEIRQQSARMRAEFAAAGAPDDAAASVAHLFDVDGAVGLAKLALDAGIKPRQLTGAFTRLGAQLGLDWAQGVAATMRPSDVWERLLVAGLARDFQQMRLDFLRRLSRRKGAKEDMAGAVENWAGHNDAAIRQFRAMIGRAQNHIPVAPAMLAQIASQARNILAR